MYIIYGKSRFGTEELDTADTRQEANSLVREYKMAFGAGWTIWQKKAK